MHTKTKKIIPWVAGIATMAAVGTTVHAQSSDALIDKLVDKGILSVKEANELREEADKGFNSAYSVKSGMPDWVTSMKLNGDFRGRYDGIYGDNASLVDRHRFRYRLRFGAVAVMKEDFEAGLRLSSGEPVNNPIGGDPISGNTTFTGNGSRKFVYIDLAYGKWRAVNNSLWSATFTFGKMENPFVFSDMVFDPDYTPEGFGEQFAINLSKDHALKLNFGEFALSEVSGSSRDSYLFGAQTRLDSTWTPKIGTSFGFSALAITSDQALRGSFNTTTPARTQTIGGTSVTLDPATTTTTASAVPDINRGNTRGANGFLTYNYNPLVVDGAFTYSLASFPQYTGAFPIRLAADYMHNPAAPIGNDAYSLGVTFGKSGKKGLWEVGYRYKVLESDSFYEELVDSDFGGFYQAAPAGGSSGYGPGTNLRGHIFKASYSVTDGFTLGITYFMVGLINENPVGSNNEVGRLQLDAIWKF